MGTPRTGTVADDPRMLALWDRDANGGVDPGRVGQRSSHKKWWRCHAGPDHTWQAPPSSIFRAVAIGFTGCPCCAGRRLSVTNSFAALFPDGVPLWDTDSNDGLTPDMVLAGSPAPVWWMCPEGPDHRWQVSPLVMGRHSIAHGRRGCPFCAGKRPSVTNSVAAHPQLSVEWHPTSNGDLRPDGVVASTGRKLWWRCLENPGHEWPATGANRTRGRGCPYCKKSLRSVLEVGLAFELQVCFPELDLAADKVVVDGVIRHVDLLLPEQRLVIEVDGRYRHAGEVEHARDIAKTQLLTAAGYRVLRLREAPLSAITTADALVPQDVTIKQAADAVLTRLRELGWVPLPMLDAYLADMEPRRVELAVAHLQAMRPGRKIRLPGPRQFTRSQRWEDGLAVLNRFVAREGHANVPWEHIEDGFLLGKWVGAKRAQRRRGRMHPDREATLTALPGWTWDAVQDHWEDGYRALLAFLDREGHITVPTEHRTDDGFPLGTWVRSHRRPGGGRRTITVDQAARLEALPGWTYASSNDAFWEKAVSAFETFAVREGHCQTPRHHREDGVNIDAWSKQQRAKFHRGELPQDRVARLEAISGWSWSPQADAWERGYAALESYVNATGSARVRRDEIRVGVPLGVWVGEQRQRYTRGALPDVRRARLEALLGWTWDPHRESWDCHFAALTRFVDREGNARVPTDHVEDGLPLGSWVIRHRQDHKAGTVPTDRAVRLEALPGWTWDVRVARWHAHYDALALYVDRKGHARVPGGHREGDLKLGTWVIAQRQGRRSGTLTAERAALLAALPGWTWDMREAAWTAGFEALRQYQLRTGHGDVPRDWVEKGYRLGQWVGVQRAQLKAGKLSEERAAKLAAMPGWQAASIRETLPFG